MINVDFSSKVPAYLQIYSQLKAEIASGELSAGSQLPSLRTMGTNLNVSRNTVDQAYQQLCAEGYLSSRQGRGYFVEDVSAFDLSGGSSQNTQAASDPKLSGISAVNTSGIDQIVRAMRGESSSQVAYDFDYNSVYSSSLPWPRWKKCLQAATIMHEEDHLLSYEDKRGNLYLRSTLCEFLLRYRGIHYEPSQIVVVSSSQYAMAIAVNLFDPSRQGFIMEDPGSLSMRKIISDRGYSIESIPVGPNGVEAQLLEQIPGDILYLSPSHNFPTGYTTSTEKREEIIRWAGESKSRFVIENDRDFEFRSTSMPIPSIKSLDSNDKVIHIGTLSRLLSPSMRCAYLVLPQQLVQRFDEAYRFFFSMLPTYHQMAIAMMIEKGALDKHFTQLRKTNRRKHQIMQQAIKQHLGSLVKVVSNPEGLFVMVHVKGCNDPHELQSFLLSRSIKVRPVVDYCHDGTQAYQNAFLLGYSAMDEEQIPQACKALAEALRAYLER